MTRKEDAVEDLLQTKTGETPLIVIVSNRGPYAFSTNDSGDLVHQRGAGGLVTALGALRRSTVARGCS